MGFSRSVFDEYHRARRIRTSLTALGWGAAVSAVIGALALLGASSPSRVEASVVAPLPTTATTPGAAGSGTSSAEVPATQASAPPSPSVAHTSSSAAEPATPGPAAFRIVITATGYQTELDACQWVRMDLLATAPFVGAHTSCGGAVVLDMKPGDRVTLVGQGLDGTFRVVGARGAHAGDVAATAVDGMTASVILQTCYPGTGGRERLVGLQLEP